MTRGAAIGANLSAHAIAFSMGYSGETAMKTADHLASGILLLATIETLLVVLSRMLSALTEPQAQNSLARYRLQARRGQQVRLRFILAASAALAFAGAYRTVYLGILLGL